MVEKSHTNLEAVGNLLQDARLGAIGNARIDFQAADHGTGMQNERVFSGEAQALGRELKLQNIFFGREGRFVETLSLHAEHDDYVGAVERFIDMRDAADTWSERFQFARHPHGGSAQGDVRAKFTEQMNVGARHTAVQDVAKDGET